MTRHATMTNRNDIQNSMHVLAMTWSSTTPPLGVSGTHTTVAPVQRIPTTLPLRAYDPVIIPAIITRPPPRPIHAAFMLYRSRVVDGGVTATGVLSRQRGNLITIVITHY